jgi:hypothetical protein
MRARDRGRLRGNLTGLLRSLDRRRGRAGGHNRFGAGGGLRRRMGRLRDRSSFGCALGDSLGGFRRAPSVVPFEQAALHLNCHRFID